MRKPMISQEKQNIIPLLAITVLLIATASTVYVHATQNQQSIDSESIMINNQTFTMNTLMQSFTNMTIQTDDGEKTGIALSNLLLSTNLDCPTCHSYILISSDGYQQTVDWDDMQQGVLSLEKRVYFPNLAHAFWVRNIIEIEVKI